MTVVDPRDSHDDLLETESRELLPPGEFADAADSEPVESGWVVLGVAFDDAGRVLLVDQPWADGWILPGGAHRPGETLAETAGWTLAVYEAVADSPETDRDPAVDDEEVLDVRWFDGLPENVYNPGLIERTYERCERT